MVGVVDRSLCIHYRLVHGHGLFEPEHFPFSGGEVRLPHCVQRECTYHPVSKETFREGIYIYIYREREEEEEKGGRSKGARLSTARCIEYGSRSSTASSFSMFKVCIALGECTQKHTDDGGVRLAG